MSLTTLTSLAGKALMGVAVLGVASGAAVVVAGSSGGAAAIMSSPGASAPYTAEIYRLQGAFGPSVIKSAAVQPGSNTIAITTKSMSLLYSATPEKWLGTSYQVVVTWALPRGIVKLPPGEQCDSSTDIPMMSDTRG